MKTSLLAVALVAALPVAVAGPNNGGGSTAGTAGPIVIDQARAEAGGVTPGDAPGFPVTISLPGSYRLTGNLTVADIHATAIVVGAPDVSIDLGGFSIVGPVVCPAWQPGSCNPAAFGSGDGIRVQVAQGAYANASIVNGTVRGMGRYGVYVVSPGAVVQRLRAIGNRGGGISANAGTISDSMVLGNGGAGISGNTLTILGNNISGNGNYGIQTNSASGFANNVLQANQPGNVGSYSARPLSPNLCDGLGC